MSEEHKTITLVEFAKRATEGEVVEQELTGGERIEARVFTPDQTDLLDVQKIMMRIVRVADTARSQTDIADDDATLAYELGLAALRACVRDDDGERVPDIAVVELFSKLPYKAALMVRCQELCGVTMISVPPIDNAMALEAVKQEAAEVAGNLAAKAKPNRKERRKAASTGGKRTKSDNFEQMRDEQERDYTKHT